MQRDTDTWDEETKHDAVMILIRAMNRMWEDIEHAVERAIQDKEKTQS